MFLIKTPIFPVLNTLPFGLSVSASARIGNLIGSRKPRHAKLSAHTAAFLSVCLGATVMVILLFEKDVSKEWTLGDYKCLINIVFWLPF